VVEGDQAESGRRLLVLGAGPAQLGLLAAARERGLFVIAADRDPAAPGFRYADRRAIVSTEDEPAIERLALAERLDGVIAPGIDWPVAIAARVASRCGLPHPLEPAAAVLATSKLRQRERFAEAGVPQPRWKLTAEPDDELGFPCVVKAPDRQGQRGLSLVTRPEDLPPAVEAAVASSRGNVALIEELVRGPEVTVNAVSVDGAFHPLTLTDRLVADPPAFGVALAHAWPSETAGPDAAEVAARAAEALGIRNGPTYTQLRLGPDGPRVVELAARLGGGHDAELCRVALGVDLNGLALAAALGEPVSVPEPRPAGGACVRFLVPPEGELRAVEGVEQARALDGVREVLVYRRPGHRFGPLRVGGDRAGAVIAVGASRDEALERARRAAERVRFDTADAEALV
jgi:biotin carboxylase